MSRQPSEDETDDPRAAAFGQAWDQEESERQERERRRSRDPGADRSSRPRANGHAHKTSPEGAAAPVGDQAKAKAKEPPRDEPPEVGPDDPVELDLAALSASDPQPPRFIIPDWLPAGEVTLLAGDGGTGKSLAALTMAVCLASGRPFFGVPVQQRPVAFLSYEDPAEVLHWRLARICAHLGISLASLPLRVFDGTVGEAVWFGPGLSSFGLVGSGATSAYSSIRARLAAQAQPGRVIVVDNASDTFGGSENNRGEVKRFVRLLRRLVDRDGAVLLAAHVDKPAAREGGEALGYSGSTGWNNSVRARWYLFRQQEEGGQAGEVALEVRKSNLGSTGHRMVLRFDTNLHVFQRTDEPSSSRPQHQAVDESDAIVRIVREAQAAGNHIPAATSGTRTAHSCCEAYGCLPGSLRGKRGRVRFYKTLEQLRVAGAVYTEAVKRPHRNTAEVLCTRN